MAWVHSTEPATLLTALAGRRFAHNLRTRKNEPKKDSSFLGSLLVDVLRNDLETESLNAISAPGDTLHEFVGGYTHLSTSVIV
jgi:hypothetical protein